jgi:DNA adenine methylase
MRKIVKSPLRYPGGKSRAIQQIAAHLPLNMREFREPLVGGGSAFLAVRSLFGSQVLCKINDIQPDLIHFWRFLRDDSSTLIEIIKSFRASYQDNGRELYQFLKDERNMRSDLDRAVRFFIMNRITFSGVMDAGGYSQQAFETRFTESSIDRLETTAPLLRNVEMSRGDYEPLLFADGEGVFIFLDPPYLSATNSKLYGERGILHTTFDHVRFADAMRRCPHRWLITYDDSPQVRELFSFATIIEWELQYGMNNYKQATAAKGKELFIRNY